jgi:hypothetical protein
MLKKVGLPLLALAALLMLVPAQNANAAVRFGVAVGGPVYAYPAYPGPYAYPHSDRQYNAYPSYSYSAPSYAYGDRGQSGREWREDRERESHERREWRGRGEHEDRDRDRDGRR